MKKTLLRGEANLIYLFIYTYVIMLGARVCVKKTTPKRMHNNTQKEVNSFDSVLSASGSIKSALNISVGRNIQCYADVILRMSVLLATSPTLNPARSRSHHNLA